MHRSLFQKYLWTSVFVVFLSFITLSVMVLYFVADYWESDKKDNLIENANQVASVITAASDYNAYNHTLIVDDPNLFSVTISTIAKSTDADIFVVNNKGKLQYCSEGENCTHTKGAIPSTILGKTINGSFFEFGTLDDYYSETYYTAGVPIVVNTQGVNEAVAFCYVSTRSSFVSGLTISFSKIFITSILLTMLIVFCLVSILTYNMAKPLRQMSTAAKKLAVGDFSTRVTVNRDDEIGELATAFNYMAESLSSSEGMRRSFIANVSHELKTPMTTIAGFIDGMLDGTIPKDRHPHYMRIVSNEVKRLSRLVQSMLSLSRIDNGELRLSRQDFEMFSTIVTILSGFEQKISDKKIEIRGLENFKSLTVNADPDLMHQVIYNLIENAVKFTNEGGYIEFSVIETGYDVSVAITNSGPGIPPEDIRYIFDRFYKTDKSRSMDKKGMGLGLFIAKSIMRLHGGDIYAESQVDDYCRFTFRLPKVVGRHSRSTPQNKQYIETTATIETEE